MYQYELQHHGIKGQRWGVRRFQNDDGSLTPAGEKRYARAQSKVDKAVARFTKGDQEVFDTRSKNRAKMESKYDKKINKAMRKNDLDKAENLKSAKNAKLKDYDEGTEIFKKAQASVNEKYKAIMQMKADAVLNPSIKKTEEYKAAGKQYADMKSMMYVYGKAGLVLDEAYSANRPSGSDKRDD